MLLDVVTAAFAVGPLVLIAIPQPQPEYVSTPGPFKASVWADFRAALAYLLHWRGLMLLTGVGLVAKLALTPAASLIPILVTQHFDGGAGELATGEALMGVGVITGGLLLGVWGGFRRSIYTMLSGIMLLGLAMLALGLLPAHVFPAAAGALFVTGAAVALVDGPFMAIMQKSVAPEMHGRVFMLFNSLISLSSPVGLAIAGPFTDFAGIQTLYVIAGAMLGGMGIFGLFTPAILHIEDHPARGQTPPVDGLDSDTALAAPVHLR
jgi:DHA3 family macrolide efflux protein-like MFS transporter